tara:strand:- start:102 stop:1964 length:1863 start_codon:yes stop_codon:yes gene_type:complete
MNYSKHKNNLIIFTLLFLSFLFSIFLWPKIILPYTNVHNVAGIYDNLKYSSHNDVTRYIFFIGFPVLTFFISLLLFKKEKMIHFNDLFKSNNEFFIVNKDQKKVLFFSFIIFGFYILIEFLSLGVPDMKIDRVHDGDYLTAAMNYLLTNKIWSSSYAVHGASMSIYPNIMWKIFNVESIGAFRLFPVFMAILVKSFSLYFAFQLTKIVNVKDSFKVIFFILFSFLILSMSDFDVLVGGYNLISFRDLYLIFFLILLFNIIILKKNNYINIFLITIIPSLTMLLHTDIGIYLNFTLIFLMIYFYFSKKNKNWFIILIIAIFWLLTLKYMGLNDFKLFFKNILILTSSIDYLMGNPYPEPFFDTTGSKHASRATKGLVLQLIAGLLVTYKVFIKNDNIENKKKVFFIFLFILSFIFYRNALGRSDSYHIRMSSDLPILIISFFTIEYLLMNIQKIFIFSKDKTTNYITLVIFLLTISYLGFSKFNYSNIKNIQNRYSEFVRHEDSYFMNNDTINIINYLKEVTKDEKCIENFTYDLSIPFFLKKTSCTPYYSSWLASPTVLQQDYIKRLKIAKPNYIIYKSKHFVDNLQVYERLELVNSYIIRNYDFHINIDDFLIYKLKNI